MNAKLRTIAGRQGGVFTTAQAATAGYSQGAVLNLLADGEWHRLRRGAYVEQSLLESLDGTSRHAVHVRAVMLTLGARVAVSHVSALALHGLTVWGADLSRVHVTRRDGGSGRVHADVVHHCGQIGPDEIDLVDGVRTVSVARAVVEHAATSSFESGVVSADAALHTGRTSPGDLRRALEAIRSWPGARDASAAIPFADGRCEGVGESIGRVLMHEQGLPAPDLQREFFDAVGRFIGRVDFVFEAERTIVEFDGRVKYRGMGKDPAEVVIAEKRREDRLRELGYEVVRLDWSDLARPRQTATRIRQAFERARTLRRTGR